MSETPKEVNVTVRLKRGSWEVEITCPEDRVQQAVASVLAGMSTSQGENTIALDEASGARKGETCRSLLVQMWKEGYFSEPRLLVGVHEELSRRGYHYDRSAVSHTLHDLVVEGTLYRDGDQRNYRYMQKRPLSTQPATTGP
ncbi:MAG TPA: hypothetical protein VEJ36_05295 [Nitrososphaerales archaeon]|nr:hypothetical protein [Nitrososphaerales archaeon]